MNDIVRATQLASALILASAALEVSAKPSPPVGLLVNGVSNPLAIERDATRFTWRSADASRGERQTAYQILVSSSPERLAAGTGRLVGQRQSGFGQVGFG